jgi:hypothetical protein
MSTSPRPDPFTLVGGGCWLERLILCPLGGPQRHLQARLVRLPRLVQGREMANAVTRTRAHTGDSRCGGFIRRPPRTKLPRW